MEEPPSPASIPARLQLAPGPWTTLLEGLCARFASTPPALYADTPDDFGRPLQLLARSLGVVDPVCGATRHFRSRPALA